MGRNINFDPLIAYGKALEGIDACYYDWVKGGIKITMMSHEFGFNENLFIPPVVLNKYDPYATCVVRMNHMYAKFLRHLRKPKPSITRIEITCQDSKTSTI